MPAAALTARSSLRLLVDRGLLPPDSILDPRLHAIPSPGRNGGIRILRGSGGGFFVKRGSGRIGAPPSLVPSEARLHRLAAGDRSLRGLRPFLPPFHGYDAATDTLITGLRGRGGTLEDLHRAAPPFPAGVARASGALLAGLHAAVPGESFPGGLPWVLRTDLDGERLLGEERGAGGELLALVAAHPGFRAGAAALRAEWTSDCLVHGDVRWSNFVVASRGAGRAPPRLCLVDWETAHRGDGAWDLGAAFHSYWAHRFLAVRNSRRLRPALPRGADDGAADAVRATWKGYASVRRPPGGAGPFLRRAVRSAGARLVQTAYESARREGVLDDALQAMVQRGIDLLRFPERALAGGAPR